MQLPKQILNLLTAAIALIFPSATIPDDIDNLASLFLKSFDSQNATLDYQEWWGPEELKGKVDTSIRPTEIQFNEEMIEDLRYRLQNHKRFKASLKNSNFTYGFNTDVIQYWIDYWAKSYDFKARETFLNQFPQYILNVQGLDIHFIWVKPENPQNKTVVPLLLLHGWPGSIREFYESIPLLTKDDDSRDFAVEVIVPALPGFGFSDAAVKPGLGSAQMAILFKNFMNQLGYGQFYLQGGDWGSIIGDFMTAIFPQGVVLGYHTNWGKAITPRAILFQAAGALDSKIIPEPKELDRMYPLTDIGANLLEETGYFHEQATKPDTVGIALTDSPSGLLAYILEKYSVFTNVSKKFQPDGGLHESFTPDQLFDNLMFYWATDSITSSMRIYAETLNKKQFALGLVQQPTPVPTWIIQARYELTYQPEVLLKTRFTNLLHTTVLEYGGHFFAFEHPDVFSNDVLTALAAFRSWNANPPKNEPSSILGKAVQTIEEAGKEAGSIFKKLFED